MLTSVFCYVIIFLDKDGVFMKRKKRKLKKNVKRVLVCFIIILLVILCYYLFLKDSNLFSNINNKENNKLSSPHLYFYQHLYKEFHILPNYLTYHKTHLSQNHKHDY